MLTQIRYASSLTGQANRAPAILERVTPPEAGLFSIPEAGECAAAQKMVRLADGTRVPLATIEGGRSISPQSQEPAAGLLARTWANSKAVRPMKQRSRSAAHLASAAKRANGATR